MIWLLAARAIKAITPKIEMQQGDFAFFTHVNKNTAAG
jgi:DNA-binding transcriptional regulator YiaG